LPPRPRLPEHHYCRRPAPRRVLCRGCGQLRRHPEPAQSHELDDTQEINYRFVAKTIADLGYNGYVTHEFRPTPGRDPIQSLTQALEIMDV